MAVYPFFWNNGRDSWASFKIAGIIYSSTGLKANKEQYGERETVTRGHKTSFAMFCGLGVLKDATKKGVYLPVTPNVITDKKLTAWLVGAILISGNSHSGLISVITQSPILFPFTLEKFSNKTLQIINDWSFFSSRSQ